VYYPPTGVAILPTGHHMLQWCVLSTGIITPVYYDTYDGQWEDGNMHGKGMYTWHKHGKARHAGSCMKGCNPCDTAGRNLTGFQSFCASNSCCCSSRSNSCCYFQMFVVVMVFFFIVVLTFWLNGGLNGITVGFSKGVWGALRNDDAAAVTAALNDAPGGCKSRNFLGVSYCKDTSLAENQKPKFGVHQDESQAARRALGVGGVAMSVLLYSGFVAGVAMSFIWGMISIVVIIFVADLDGPYRHRHFLTDTELDYAVRWKKERCIAALYMMGNMPCHTQVAKYTAWKIVRAQEDEPLETGSLAFIDLDEQSLNFMDGTKFKLQPGDTVRQIRIRHCISAVFVKGVEEPLADYCELCDRLHERRSRCWLFRSVTNRPLGAIELELKAR
jgi:hypothetical protein